MVKNYHISVDTLTAYIDEFSSILKQYGNINLVLNVSSDDSYTEHYTKIFLKKPFDRLQPLRMSIGVNSLIENIDNNNMVSDEDVVNLVWTFYHEMTHVQNHMKDYIDKTVDDDIRQAAIVDVIADYIDDFRYYAEKYFPSELKAECNAFKMTEDFFYET